MVTEVISVQTELWALAGLHCRSSAGNGAGFASGVSLDDHHRLHVSWLLDLDNLKPVDIFHHFMPLPAFDVVHNDEAAQVAA